MSAPFVRLEEDFVREDVQPLLNLALDILGIETAEDVAECAFSDIMVDGLAGPCDELDQKAQFRLDMA